MGITVICDQCQEVLGVIKEGLVATQVNAMLAAHDCPSAASAG